MSEESRREFLKKTAVLLGAGATGIGLSAIGCAASTAPVMRVEALGAVIRFETAIPELANPGDGVALVTDRLDYPILLIRGDEGSFTAVSSECTHLGCTVKKQKSVLRCPCHGSAYSYDGEVLNGPSEIPLHQFTLTRSGSIVEIRL